MHLGYFVGEKKCQFCEGGKQRKVTEVCKTTGRAGRIPIMLTRGVCLCFLAPLLLLSVHQLVSEADVSNFLPVNVLTKFLLKAKVSTLVAAMKVRCWWLGLPVKVTDVLCYVGRM